MSIDPQGMTVTQWTDAMAIDLTGKATTPRLDAATHWQQWALVVCQAPRIARANPPNPLFFADWREWAVRFNESIDLT